MELDELKANWKSIDLRVTQLERKQTLKPAGNRLKLEPIFELIVGALTAVWTGNLLANNFSRILSAPWTAVPALLLDALAIFTISLSIRQLSVISSFDYSGSVVQMQRKVAQMRAMRVRSTRVTFLAGLPLWMIFPTVAGQAIFGIDFVRAVSAPWIFSNVIFGVILVAVIVFTARRSGERSRFFRWVDNVFAGAAIVEAEARLAEVSEFANEA